MLLKPVTGTDCAYGLRLTNAQILVSKIAAITSYYEVCGWQTFLASVYQHEISSSGITIGRIPCQQKSIMIMI